MSRSVPTYVSSSEGVEVTLHDFGGPSDGPVLVMCHATGFHGRVFAPMARSLSGCFRCVAPDFRGHGTTTVSEGTTYVWDRLVDDLLAVIDGVGGGPIRAFGWSLGGAAIVAAELRRAGTIEAAFVYEPVIASSAFFAASLAIENPLADAARRRTAVFDDRQQALDRYRSRPPFSDVHPAALAAYVEHGFAEQPDGTVRLRCQPETEATVFESWRSGLFDDLSGLTAPMTIGVGGESTLTTVMASMAVEAMPGARLRVFDDLTHFGPLEDPDTVGRAVAEAVHLS